MTIPVVDQRHNGVRWTMWHNSEGGVLIEHLPVTPQKAPWKPVIVSELVTWLLAC
jgi:hypothetical protein